MLYPCYIIKTRGIIVLKKKNDFPGIEDIFETVREPLLVLDANLNILSANRSFYTIFKVEQG